MNLFRRKVDIMLHKGLMKQAQKVLQPTVFKLGQLKAAERQVISSFIDKNNIDPIKGAVRLRQVFSKEDLKALRRKALEMGSVSLVVCASEVQFLVSGADRSQLGGNSLRRT